MYLNNRTECATGLNASGFCIPPYFDPEARNFIKGRYANNAPSIISLVHFHCSQIKLFIKFNLQNIKYSGKQRN